MTTFTNPHERIEQLMLRIEQLEALLHEVRGDACGGNLDDDLRADIDAALDGTSVETQGEQYFKAILESRTETLDVIKARIYGETVVEPLDPFDHPYSRDCTCSTCEKGRGRA